eukprot:GDKI01034512.1.p1 GENE.GDKI01034512.1~~GDKI01034512.1.p1  ORF type:complete len:253 (-),score=39.66 GDKI01034512.1:134-892(-)
MWAWTKDYETSKIDTVSSDIRMEIFRRQEGTADHAPPPRVAQKSFLRDSIDWVQGYWGKLLIENAAKHWRVKFLVDALSAMKSPVQTVWVKCEPGAPHKAGYSPKYNTVWFCTNCVWTPWSFNRTLQHEMLHAFDFARAKIDPCNCEHIACAELRAYNLSGQCSQWATLFEDPSLYTNTVAEAQSNKKMRCLSHKTIASLRDNMACQGNGQAEAATSRVFERCVADTFPFTHQPERDSTNRENRQIHNRWRE